MDTLLIFFLPLVVVITLFFFRISLIVSIAVLGLFLIGCTYLFQPSIFVLVVLWGSFLGISIPISLPQIRRPLLSDKVFHLFKKVLPPMSQTERDALEAGTVWFDRELFSGNPDWKELLEIELTELREDEKAFINGTTDELCGMLDDWKITHEDQDMSPEAWEFMKKQGFFGMIIPKEYGGLGFSARAHSEVIMKLASRSTTAAVTVMVPNSLGPAELLMNYGTREQKEFYLPRLASGDDIPCFALTAPTAGSDASSIPDTGIVCNGKFNDEDILGIRLNWEKRYITLGPVATILGLAFKMYDPDHLLGEQEELGITCALIHTDLPGITIGERHFPMNSAFLTGPNYGKDVFIPIDWIIGGRHGAGKGWKMLMECLAAGRSISLPALSTGAAKSAASSIGAYSRIRKQFNLPIGKFEGIEEKLASMAGNVYLMEAARLLTASGIDKGEKPSVISAIVKYNLTERMRVVINDGMDIQSGAAVCLGPRNYIGRNYESIPISICVEGANILTRSFIIFNQGIIRCHPYVLKEFQAVGDTNRTSGVRNFDAALFSHIGFVISNYVRTFFHGLTCGYLAMVPGKGAIKRYFQHLTRMSAAFALVADVTMLVLGGSLKRKEKISGRLSDVVSQLYLMSSVLKRYEADGRPHDDLSLVKWACDDALYKIQGAFEGILQNMPVPVLPAILRFIIFPLGRHFAPPKDYIGHQSAQHLLAPSVARDRLIGGIYLPKDENDPVGRLEKALELVIMAEPIEGKLRAALKTGTITSKQKDEMVKQGLANGVIEKSEAETLALAEAIRSKVIAVDSFQTSDLQAKSTPAETQRRGEDNER